jgi:hypothetical protein
MLFGSKIGAHKNPPNTGIKELDKSVAEATSTRKEEHDNYVETLAGNNAAKDLLGFAKNRLNKFSGHCLGELLNHRNYIQSPHIFVGLYDPWGPLDVCKIILGGVAMVCPPGKHYSDKIKFGYFFGCPSMPGSIIREPI